MKSGTPPDCVRGSCMRNDASRLKYLAFVVCLGACFFDPKATGPGNQSNPQFMDGSIAGTEGGAGGNGGTGAAAESGGGASGTSGGTGSPGTSGTGGMSVATAGMDAPPL